MSTYLEEVISTKKYVSNVVIQIDTNYFSIRQPDSGLTIPVPYDRCVDSLILNPTSLDIRKVTTTISTFSFKLLDKDGIITALVLGDAANLNGQAVRIFLGRSNVDMDFADYFELPTTYISKLDHGENSYNISSSEQTERLNRPIYNLTSAVGVDLLIGTTIWTMRDDITDFPTSGFLKIDDEFVSYSGKDLINNRFTGVIRGELNSIPAEHDIYTDCYLVETITDNPLNIILKILISGGGGGTYDVLDDGLGIDQNLVDIAEIEALRDELFLGHQFTLSMYNIASALKYIETELLMVNQLRFTFSRNSKLTLAILDKARFVEEDDIIDEDTITKFPKWTIDGDKLTNIIEAEWDYNEGTGKFQAKDIYEDAPSIALYGRQTPLKFKFKGLKATLDGQLLVDDFGTKLVERLAVPTPIVSINTQIDKSLQTIGDKSYLVSSKIPAADGSLNFASNLEIISRGINHTTGDVQFKLAFTSYTNIRSAFICPSDLVTETVSQSRLKIAVGRGAQYLVGWYMLLWDEVGQVYEADPPNKIVGIEEDGNYLLTESGNFLIAENGNFLTQEADIGDDTIIFENNWTTTVTFPNTYRIRFADYDEATASQHRYGFISDGGANFDDGTPTYKVTY